MHEGDLFGQVGIARVGQLGEELVDVGLGATQDAPDRAHGLLEVFEVALLGRDDPFPVPLVDVHAVVVVEEVVLAHGTHVGAQTLAGIHAELLERDPLPFGGRLDNLRVDRMLIVVVADVEPDRRPRAVAVEHIVDARLDVDDQRHLHADEVQLTTQVFLDVVLDRIDGELRFARIENRVVVGRQHLGQLLVGPDARSGQVGNLARCGIRDRRAHLLQPPRSLSAIVGAGGAARQEPNGTDYEC